MFQIRLNIKRKIYYDFKLDYTLDEKVLLKEFKSNLANGKSKTITVDVKNTDRSFGTILGSEITRSI